MTAGFYALGGASTVIENLADQLGKRGVEVTIGALTFNGVLPKGAYNVSKLPIHNVSKLKRFLDHFDIVHSHHPLVNYLALVSRRPFVYHYHGAPSPGIENPFRLSMLLSVKLTNHAFDAVVAVSESAATELERYFGFNNVHIIYNGVKTDLFKPEIVESFRKGTPQFLFVGNLYEHKNVEELILAVKELVKAYPKAHLQIIGRGHAYRKLERLVARLDLLDHVDFAGYVSQYRLPYYYSSCDVYVTTSKYETYSLPLLEAWACGKPVVASQIHAHSELLLKSKAGMLYTLGDTEDLFSKMIAVFERKDTYKSQALIFAKKHDWSVVADKVLDVYALIS